MSEIYSNFKFLRYADRIKAFSERRIESPVHIRIKPMNYCNHDCWYCSYRASNVALGEDMDYKDKLPEAKAFEIVEDVIEMGVKAVTFSGGGEPLLYKSLPEMVSRLAKGGVRVATLTNGSNLKGKVADAFAKHGTWVRVSTDAWDDASFAKSRSIREGEFSKLLHNMREFTAKGSRCVLGVSFIVDETNCSHLYDACALLKDTGINHVRFSGVIVGDSRAEINAYHARIRKTVTEQIERARGLADEHFAVINHYHDLEHRFQKSYTVCPYIMLNPVIGADCKVYTCHDKAFTEAGMLGSIMDRRLRDFWFSDENRLRIFGLDPSRDCRHHCAANARNLVIMDYLSIDPDHNAFV